MGHAAYMRGCNVISRKIEEEFARPKEFEIMDQLNAYQKVVDPTRPWLGATRPFGPVHFVAGNGGWWATCPTSGFGYWYKRLRDAVAAWDVMVVEYDATGTEPVWKAIPTPVG